MTGIKTTRQPRDQDAGPGVKGRFGRGVGLALLGLWGLPDNIVESTAFHHKPDEAPGEGFSTLTAVHVANALAHEFDPESGEVPCPRLNEAYPAELGLAHRVSDWGDACRKILEEETEHERENLVCR